VYFYGATGRFQPTSLFGVVALIKALERGNSFSNFTRLRRKFEDFLLNHKYLSNQITQKQGSGLKGYQRVFRLYQVIIAGYNKGLTTKQIEQAIVSDPKLSFLRMSPDQEERQARKNFSSDAKSATFLKEAQASLLECRICRGYIHRNSITFDHIVDKRSGGTGAQDNAQLAHPFCNSTYKDLLAKQAVSAKEKSK